MGFGFLRLNFMGASFSLSENSEDDYKTQGSRIQEMARGEEQGMASQPLSSCILRGMKSLEDSYVLLLKAKLRPLPWSQ